MKTCSGREIFIEFGATLYFVENRKVIQCNIRDITEKKKLDQMKTEFVSMVSHELRTPLSAIKEGVEIVSDGTQGHLNKSQKECLGIALSNIKRLNRLIGDILDISKIQSDLLKIKLVPCDVYEVVEHVYSLVRFEIEKRGMIFVTDLANDLPPVRTDKDRLIQIILNLLNNAVKFTREKSKITLSCRQTGSFVEFGVRDEGAGIPSDDLARLFGKFVQLDSSLIRRVGGTGLGLYISRNLVEAMGGTIWAESKVGEGSVFKFTMPI
jgi:signal transduction histidine kinase